MTNLIIQNFLQTGKISLDPLRAGAADSTVKTNALLRKDEWERIDDAVLEVARTELVGVADLINAGLTQDLGGLGTIISTYEQLSDMTAAQVSMTGVAQGERDRVTFTPVSVPVPIIHKDFQLDIRHLLASRNKGEALDTTQSRIATEQVTRRLEAILFNGYSQNLGGNVIYGYTNHPSRNTDTAANFGGGDFGTAGNGFKTIKGMIKVLRDDGYNGPYGCYVATTQYDQLLNLYGSLDNTELGIIMDRIPELSFVKPSYDLANENVVVVSMTRKVVDLGVAEGIQAVMWQELGGFLIEFRTFSAMVPRVKSDKEGKSGVAHATGA